MPVMFNHMMQVVIDSCCATFAEVQKRGKDFWAEFELYAADLLVGVVVDIALVGMLAPYSRIGKRSISSGRFGGIHNFVRALPSRSIMHARVLRFYVSLNPPSSFIIWLFVMLLVLLRFLLLFMVDHSLLRAKVRLSELFRGQ